MTEEEFRKQILQYLAANHKYAVVCDGHFSRYICILENNRDLKTEIYSAIFESYYDLTKDDKEIFRTNFAYDEKMTYEKMLELIAIGLQ